MKKKEFSKVIKQSNFKRWRKERGIKIVCSIVPFRDIHRATCLFEGNTYVGVGDTNSQALDNLFDFLKKKAELDVPK